MVLLRRLFKKKAVAPLIAQAERFLGPGWQVTLTDTLPPDAAAQTRLWFFPLHVDDVPVGSLRLQPPADATVSETSAPDVRRTGLFLAGCLENLLSGEALRRTLANETLLKYREIALLHRATVCLNGSLRPREVAQALLSECQRDDLPAEAGMVFLTGTDTGYEPAVAYGPVEPSGLAGVAASTLFREIARSQKGEIINELDSDRRWNGEADLQSLLLSPLVAAGRTVGMLVLASLTPRRFEASHLQHIGTLTSVAGIAFGNALHFEAVQTLIHSLMQALATAIDARDPFTAGHSHRVARLGVALAKVVHHDRRYFPEVTFTPSDLEELLYAGLLHDVGKIGIREEVLTKSSRLPRAHLEVIGERLRLRTLLTGKEAEASRDFSELSRINVADVVTPEDADKIKRLGAQTLHIGDRDFPILTEPEMACLLIARGNLTPEERREIERHPAESYRILQHIPFPANMRRLLTIIFQHHERLNGSGYPAGIHGDAILLQSRIIAIVDIYDAITMARHYKPALPREKAMDILWQEAHAGRIDRQLVALLDQHLDAVEADCDRLPDRLDFAEYLTEEEGKEKEKMPPAAGRE